MPKFVKNVAGRRDGVELLLSTLKDLRQEDIAAGQQEIQLRTLESQLEGERLKHVTDMTMLAQQRQQFALDHAYRMDKLEHDGEVLKLERDKLSDAEATRQANLIQSFANMNVRLSELADSERSRMGSIKQKEIDLVNSLEESKNITSMYIYGERLNAEQKPDGSGVVKLRDPRLKELYNSMANFSKGRFMSEAEFGRQWMDSYNTGLEDSRGLEEEQSFMYATKFATVNTIASGIANLSSSGNVHPNLQLAADAWAMGNHSDEIFNTLSGSVGFDNGGIVFNAKLNNDKLTGNGAMLISNNQRLNSPVRQYGRVFRETKDMNDAMEKMYNGSQKRLAEIEVQTALAGTIVTRKLAKEHGESYFKDNPFFNDGSGEGGNESGGGTSGGQGGAQGGDQGDGQASGSSEGQSGSGGASGGQGGGQTSGAGENQGGSVFVHGDQDGRGGLGGGLGGAMGSTRVSASQSPFSPQTAPQEASQGLFDTRPPGFDPNLFNLAQRVGFNLGIDNNGKPTITIKPYYDMRSGEPRKVVPITRSLTHEDFSLGVPSSAVGSPFSGGARLSTKQRYDTEEYNRVLRAAQRADRINKLEETDRVLNSPEFRRLWTQTPFASKPQGVNSPKLPWLEKPAGNSGDDQFANTGIQAGEGFYDSMRTEIYNQAKQLNLENPEVISQLGALQSTLETGHGKSVVGNNYFGIKAPVDSASSVSAQTTEFVGGKKVVTSGNFRSYGSPSESAASYLNFMIKNPRYANVLKAKTVEEAINAVVKAGYATDPKYSDKLHSINRVRNVRVLKR